MYVFDPVAERIPETFRVAYAQMLACVAMDVFVPPHGPGGERRFLPLSKFSLQARRGSVSDWLLAGEKQQALCLLHSFGTVRPPVGANGERSEWTGHQAELAMDIADIPDFALSQFDLPRASFDVALAIFLENAFFHGELSSSRNFFVAAPEYEPVMAALASAGYLGKLDKKYRWTNKAQKAMSSIYSWDKDGQSEVDKLGLYAEEMWNALPERVKIEYFLGDSYDPLGFEIARTRCFKDGIWNDDAPIEEPIILESLPVHARDLYERFVKPYKR